MPLFSESDSLIEINKFWSLALPLVLGPSSVLLSRVT